METASVVVVETVAGQKRRTNPLKDVVDEGVEDQHGLVGDTSVGVDLLEDLVDVGGAGGKEGASVRVADGHNKPDASTH